MSNEDHVAEVHLRLLREAAEAASERASAGKPLETALRRLEPEVLKRLLASRQK